MDRATGYSDVESQLVDDAHLRLGNRLTDAGGEIGREDFLRRWILTDRRRG
ncbi:MAG: hypothetical protein AAF322_07675 [Pseudomonadota bacterium]